MKASASTLIGLLAWVALVSPAAAKKNDPNISLEFRPQQAVAAAIANVSGAMLTKPVSLSVVDDRQGDDDLVIGTRTDDDDRRHVLRATSDVLAFVEEQLIGSAQRWGIDFDENASLELQIRLLEVQILETNQAVGATYNAVVRLAYSLQERGGESRMENTAFGDASRYGKKFSNENCNEVLSDAMLEVFAAVFSDHALKRAWGE